MNVEELSVDTTMVSFIQSIVNDKRFPALKDSFVSHTPAAGSPDQALGKLLGTRYVFNELEKIAKPKPKKETKTPVTHGKDPDLED